MDRVEKMRQKQQGIAPVVDKVPKQPAKNSPSPPRKKPPPQQKQAPAMVTYCCGHEKPTAAFKSGPCAECRTKINRARSDRKAQKNAEGKGRKFMEHEQRLPDGSVFSMVYNDNAKEWSGELSIPREGGHRLFSGTGSGLEKLQRQLAEKCWAWLAERVVHSTTGDTK